MMPSCDLVLRSAEREVGSRLREALFAEPLDGKLEERERGTGA